MFACVQSDLSRWDNRPTKIPVPSDWKNYSQSMNGKWMEGKKLFLQTETLWLMKDKKAFKEFRPSRRPSACRFSLHHMMNFGPAEHKPIIRFFSFIQKQLSSCISLIHFSFFFFRALRDKPTSGVTGVQQKERKWNQVGGEKKGAKLQGLAC